MLAVLTLSTVPSPANAADLQPIYRVPTQDRVAFITIDDGWEKSLPVRDYIERNRIPITSFMTTDAIMRREPYFERVSRWGSIQNHSVTHTRFGRKSTNLRREICGAQQQLQQSFGTRPWMLRPPYGDAAHAKRVRQVAQRCGITHIVMWDTSVWFGKVAYRNKGLQPGSIILLHFNKGLEKDLRIAMRLIKRAGLRPANLADYLPPPNRSTVPVNPLQQ
jgi:peptidoglycan/xylan/chitin deacetylase (PgdA/CDA1 family)